jgi:hypothetical protein
MKKKSPDADPLLLSLRRSRRHVFRQSLSKPCRRRYVILNRSEENPRYDNVYERPRCVEPPETITMAL